MIRKIAILCIAFLAANISITSAQDSSLTPVEAYGQLSISGTNIVNDNEETIQLQGMSLYWSTWGGEAFYNSDAVQEIKDEWCANVVRAAAAISNTDGDGNSNVVWGSYLTDSAAVMGYVEAVIEAAIDQGIYVIVDWHSHNAHLQHNGYDEEEKAINFFQHIAQKYGNEPNIIYEVYNEPTQVGWSSDIKPYCTSVIEAIREYDENNIVVCGTPNWSQYVDEAANDQITQYDNIAYALHYYAANTWHRQNLRDRATTAMNQGAALFVTEYGNVDSDGDGSVAETAANEWYSYLEEHNISHCNWSLSNIEEGSAALQPGTSSNGGWADNDLTASGTFVKDYLTSNCPEYKVNAIYDQEYNIPELAIYPNPAEDIIHTEGWKQGTTPAWELYNSHGQLIKQGTSSDINIAALKPGAYILKAGQQSYKVMKK